MAYKPMQYARKAYETHKAGEGISRRDLLFGGLEILAGTAVSGGLGAMVSAKNIHAEEIGDFGHIIQPYLDAIEAGKELYKPEKPINEGKGILLNYKFDDRLFTIFRLKKTGENYSYGIMCKNCDDKGYYEISDNGKVAVKYEIGKGPNNPPKWTLKR
jgi:hypothetical protein